MGLCVLGFVLPLWADDGPPARGRPVRFNGAVGNFRVALKVDRQEVRVQEPFLLTVRVTANGPVVEPPRPPDLSQLASFTTSFHIEKLSESSGSQPEKDVWEFSYRLRAKEESVEGVPSLPFVFYRPATRPGIQGVYQTTYGPGVPLTVRPAEPPPVTQREGEKPILHPESVYAITTGPAVLRKSVAWDLPVSTISFIVIAIPLGCLLWYFLWTQLYPDAARIARRQRSLAARQALAALASAGRRPLAEQPRLAVDAVASFLHHRLDLPPSPSPEEIATHLKRIGYREETIVRVVEFFRSADAARFAPDASTLANWTGPGSEVILLVEAESCAS